MTADEWGVKLQEKINRIKSGEVLFLSAGTLLGDMAERIFVKGENSSSGTFTYNTTQELWVSDFAAQKGQTNIGKTGKKIKSTYYPSYQAFRSAMSRESGFVNWRLSNELQSDFRASLSRVSGDVVEFKLSNDANVGKRKGIDDKYGKVFSVSDVERAKFLQTIQDEINLILNA